MEYKLERHELRTTWCRMIICGVCGATNNETSGHICRKCGALLPVSTRTARSRTPKVKKEKKKKKDHKPSEETHLEPIKEKAQSSGNFELQEIPKESHEINQSEVSQEIPKEEIPYQPPVEYQEIPLPEPEKIEEISYAEDKIKSEESINKTLQEITPQPFKGSVMATRKTFGALPSRALNPISDAFSELKDSVLTKEKEEPKVPISSIPPKTSDGDNAVLKQKRLEKDMSSVLSFLSKKISIKNKEKVKLKPPIREKSEEKIPPVSMNEILKRLLSLDSYIEASAIIKTDGTILASAISSRISDTLFATIGMNLSMIGTDIIDGLNAGGLKSISVRGTDGVLDLAPIAKENPSVKDMVLILFSHPKVKSGIISLAVSIVKKQIKMYLGLES